MNTRSRDTKDVASVFKFSYPQVGETSSNQHRKRPVDGTSSSRSAKSSRQKFGARRMITSPGFERVPNGRGPASANLGNVQKAPASPSFNQASLHAFFKQSTPLQKKMDRVARDSVMDRKRQSPMKSASMYKTPEKKKRIYSSDEEELEFSPSGRRMALDERRNILQNSNQWSTRMDQEERFHGVYVKSVERLKRRVLSESLQSCETSTTCSDVSESSLDLSSYEVDEEVLTRRQKQIAYGKNTEQYEYYARKVDKMSRSRRDPATPDKFDKISRRRFDGRIKTWRIMIHRWYEQNYKKGSESLVRKPAPVMDENTVTMQACGSEGTMTEAPTKTSSPKPTTRFITHNIPGMEDESAVDAFQSPKKAAVGKTSEVHTELTCDLAGFAICGNSQSSSSSNYQTRSRAKLVFS